MVSGATGRRLPCCWDDCERLGDTRWQVVARSPQRNLIYLFCSERHRLLYANSHREHKQLPVGSKSVGGPVQGVDLHAQK
jgi:hypothetical protein